MLDIIAGLIELITMAVAGLDLKWRREERAAKVEARRREDVDRINAWLRMHR